MSANSPSLSFVDKRGVWFRVLYDVLRTHSTFRDGDSLSDKGNRLGRLGLPDRLPFSDCQVKAILQVDASGSEEPLFRYNLNAIDKANNGDLHDMQGEWTK